MLHPIVLLMVLPYFGIGASSYTVTMNSESIYSWEQLEINPCSKNDVVIQHPIDCGSYILCSTVVPRLISCRNGYVYTPTPVHESEDFWLPDFCKSDPGNKCWRELPQEAEDYDYEFDAASIDPSICQMNVSMDKAYVADPETCNAFYECAFDTKEGWSVVDRWLCPEGYSFHLESGNHSLSKHCVHRPTYGCASEDSEVAGYFKVKKRDYCPRKARLGSAAQHESNCRRYYFCARNPEESWPYLMQIYECPEGFGFDRKVNHRSTIRHCTKGFCAEGDFPCEVYNLNVQWNFQNPYNCSEYYECRWEAGELVATLKACRPGRKFYDGRESCAWIGPDCPQDRHDVY